MSLVLSVGVTRFTVRDAGTRAVVVVALQRSGFRVEERAGGVVQVSAGGDAHGLHETVRPFAQFIKECGEPRPHVERCESCGGMVKRKEAA